MELVPIIYTVLVIVAAVATLTILISYTSHKIRQKKGLIEIPSIQKDEPVLSVKKIINEKHEVRPEQKVINHKLEQPKKELPSQKEKKEVINKNITPPNERIEIVKTVLPSNNKNSMIHEYEIPSPLKKSTEEKKLQSLGENIIEKYSDDTLKDMYPLKADKKKNGK